MTVIMTVTHFVLDSTILQKCHSSMAIQIAEQKLSLKVIQENIAMIIDKYVENLMTSWPLIENS